MKQAPRSALPVWDRFGPQAVLVCLAGLILYANSIGNLYAFDDSAIIQQNEYVQRGIRGIVGILSTDSFASFYRQYGAQEELSAGRYRPLSIVTFALEHQIFGDRPHVGHAVNAALFLLSMVVLLRLLRRLLPGRPAVAFLATFLFTIHPIHTEVVANIKSRDEILSLLFLLLTFLFVIRRVDRAQRAGEDGRTPGTPDLVPACVCYFLALLSKEYGLTGLVLLPMLLVLFRGMSVRRSLLLAAPFALVAALYVAIRIAVVGFHSVESPMILNNPFLLATPAQKWATKLFILGRYLFLLIRPYPLAADYSYNQIPYRNFADPGVWASILVHAGIVAAGVILWRRRHWLSFAIAFYLLHLFLVSNLWVNIGAPMGERLIYHASLGFALSAAFAIVKGMERPARAKRPSAAAGVVPAAAGAPLLGLMGVLFIPAALIVVPRNAQWKDDTTLFLHDVKVVPNSLLVNANAGRACVALSDAQTDPAQKQVLLDRAVHYLDHALSLDHDFVSAWFYLGNAYDRMHEYEKMEAAWNEARARFPGHPNFKTFDPILAGRFANQGLRAAQSGDLPAAVKLLEKAVRYAPQDAAMWYRYGRVLLLAPDRDKAREAFARAVQLDPSSEDARRALDELQKR